MTGIFKFLINTVLTNFKSIGKVEYLRWLVSVLYLFWISFFFFRLSWSLCRFTLLLFKAWVCHVKIDGRILFLTPSSFDRINTILPNGDLENLKIQNPTCVSQIWLNCHFLFLTFLIFLVCGRNRSSHGEILIDYLAVQIIIDAHIVRQSIYFAFSCLRILLGVFDLRSFLNERLLI